MWEILRKTIDSSYGKHTYKSSTIIYLWVSLVAQLVKNQSRRPRFNPWVRKIPGRREWQSTPVFLPGESRGQRCLVGYSPWGHKESDTTEVTEHECTYQPFGQSVMCLTCQNQGLTLNSENCGCLSPSCSSAHFQFWE